MPDMNYYRQALESIKRECLQNFESSEEGESADQEYMQIRRKSLELLVAACTVMDEAEFVKFKNLVIEFLCANCGCHLDYEVLLEYSPRTLSDTELKYIVENSPLARWF